MTDPTMTRAATMITELSDALFEAGWADSVIKIVIACAPVIVSQVLSDEG